MMWRREDGGEAGMSPTQRDLWELPVTQVFIMTIPVTPPVESVVIRIRDGHGFFWQMEKLTINHLRTKN